MNDTEEFDPSCNPVPVAADGCKPHLYFGNHQCEHHHHGNNSFQQVKSTPKQAKNIDYSTFDIVKATQNGALDRCKELVSLV